MWSFPLGEEGHQPVFASKQKKLVENKRTKACDLRFIMGSRPNEISGGGSLQKSKLISQKKKKKKKKEQEQETWEKQTWELKAGKASQLLEPKAKSSSPENWVEITSEGPLKRSTREPDSKDHRAIWFSETEKRL